MAGVNNYCIAVKEKGDDIVFLRKIVKGGADKSYGIQVAKLAGVPDSVIEQGQGAGGGAEQCGYHGHASGRFRLWRSKNKPKAKNYDEVDLEQISLFDTVKRRRYY